MPAIGQEGSFSARANTGQRLGGRHMDTNSHEAVTEPGSHAF